MPVRRLGICCANNDRLITFWYITWKQKVKVLHVTWRRWVRLSSPVESLLIQTCLICWNFFGTFSMCPHIGTTPPGCKYQSLGSCDSEGTSTNNVFVLVVKITGLKGESSIDGCDWNCRDLFGIHEIAPFFFTCKPLIFPKRETYCLYHGAICFILLIKFIEGLAMKS